MTYHEIDFTKVFSKEIKIDEKNELICYGDLVIGEVEKMRCGVQYILQLPIIKDERFKDLKIDTKDIFTTDVRFDSLGGIYLHRGTDYIKIGYDGSSIQILLPYMCKSK